MKKSRSEISRDTRKLGVLLLIVATLVRYLQYWGAANNSAGVSAPFTSEDCLKLAIWTPANATSHSNLPVALFWTGGGYQTNGILVPAQLPQRWIARTQSHIVVTINYVSPCLGSHPNHPKHPNHSNSRCLTGKSDLM